MRRPQIFIALFVTAFGLVPSVGGAQSMVNIPAGSYRPFYITKGIESVRIAAFQMDASAVTNHEFLDFVKANPQWARSRVSPKLAEQGYLKRWKSDFEIGDASLGTVPVTNVSWFAARAYAKWARKRLPTVSEWEFVANAAMVSPIYAVGLAKRKLILNWYTQPSTNHLRTAGTVNQNAYGVRDLFGQVWEWVEDFSSVIIPGDPQSGTAGRSTCGAGAQGTIDPSDYATFMRFAMRSSLKANYVVDNVGFRCVR